MPIFMPGSGNEDHRGIDDPLNFLLRGFVSHVAPNNIRDGDLAPSLAGGTVLFRLSGAGIARILKPSRPHLFEFGLVMFSIFLSIRPPKIS